MFGAIILRPLERPYLDAIILHVARCVSVQRAAHRDRQRSRPHVQLERHVEWYAGSPDAEEPAGRGLAAGPGDHAAGVELAATRVELAANEARGQGLDRQRAHTALHHAADGLVRDHVQLAVAVREA